MTIRPGCKRRPCETHARRLWAYLADPMPTVGAASLLEQKRIVDRTAAREQRSIDRYVVDSGSAATGKGRGFNLQAMIDEVQASGRRVTLVIAAANHLATTEEALSRALADLLRAGFVLKDGSGELHPDHATVTLAAAAVGPPRRRARHGLERDDA